MEHLNRLVAHTCRHFGLFKFDLRMAGADEFHGILAII